MLQITVTNAVAVATTAVASIVSEVSFAAVAATVASNAEAFVVVVLFFSIIIVVVCCKGTIVLYFVANVLCKERGSQFYNFCIHTHVEVRLFLCSPPILDRWYGSSM